MKFKMGRGALLVLGVGALAYVAGHFHLITTGEPGAWAQAKDPAPKAAAKEQPNPMMEAMIKAGTPGSRHRILDSLAGEWTAEFKIYMQPDQPPMVSQGTIKREWILDGRYLRESVDATSDNGTFTGVGYIGFNNIDGQYEVAWMDSMSTHILFETGTYNPQTKALLTRGSHRDPLTGNIVQSWGKMDMSNPDRQTITSYSTDPDGREYKKMEGVSQRKR